MFFSCSVTAHQKAQKLVQDKRRRERSLEMKYNKTIQELRKEAQQKRKVIRKARKGNFAKSHTNLLTKILREKDADVLDQFHSSHNLSSGRQSQETITTPSPPPSISSEPTNKRRLCSSSVSSNASSSVLEPLAPRILSNENPNSKVIRRPRSSSVSSSHNRSSKNSKFSAWRIHSRHRRNGSSTMVAISKAFGKLLSGEVVASWQGTGKVTTNISSSASDVDIMGPDSSSPPLSTSHPPLQQRPPSPSSAANQQRRLIETVQFVEAVGEIPANPGALNILDDHDSEDDDHSASKGTVVTVSLQKEEEKLLPPLTPSTPISVIDNGPPSHIDILPTPKTRPQWPFFHNDSAWLDTFCDYDITAGEDTLDGIQKDSLEVTKRGISRGNYAQLHRKAWLEVSDHYHRYGKNLRLYYRHWETLGCPTNNFFDWLDSKGDAAGNSIPNLDECPRSVLDCDMVLYITNPKVTAGYALNITHSANIHNNQSRILDVDGDPIQTLPDGWIFVIRDSVLYGAPKITSIAGKSKQRFHHSSFFGGKAVAAAGIIITEEDGHLKYLYPHSGHYRPGEADMQRCLFFLHQQGVDLASFDVDVQQISHVARSEKQKKVDSLKLVKGVDVACFLAHKASCIGTGIFTKIQRIQTSNATTVTEALEAVDCGGHWRKRQLMARQSDSSNGGFERRLSI